MSILQGTMQLWCTHAKFMGTRTVQWWFGTIFWAKLLGVSLCSEMTEPGDSGAGSWVTHCGWCRLLFHTEIPLCSTFRAWKCSDTWSLKDVQPQEITINVDKHVIFGCCVRTLHLHQPPWTRISLVLTVAHFYVSPGVGRSDHQRGRTLRTQV